MLSSLLTLSLALVLSSATADSNNPSQDLLKTGILDGTWGMTRYHYSENSNNGGSHCGKQEYFSLSGQHPKLPASTFASEQGHARCEINRLTLFRYDRLLVTINRKIDGKSFVMEPSSSRKVMLGTTGTWGFNSWIQSRTQHRPCKHTRAQPSLSHVPSIKDAVIPSDLCAATQAIPPSPGEGGGVPDRTELDVMVNVSNSSQCTTAWVRFGGTCA